MAKFNQRGTRAAVSSPIQTESVPSGRTYEDAPGYARGTQSELFLLAVTNFVGEDTFYEQAKQRDDRYSALIREATLTDPVWTFQFLRWLRAEANMRSAALVGAAEFVRASLESPHTSFAAYEIPGLSDDRALPRAVVDVVLRRADEPGEMLAYWTSKYGRSVPKPIKRGIADAVKRLYTQYTLLKYDTDSKAYRFGDVLELTHASPDDMTPSQGDLFKLAIDRRHNRPVDMLELHRTTDLDMLFANHTLRWQVNTQGEYLGLLNPDLLKDAGMTWEDALSLAGSKVDKKKLWEALIPSMGYMALIRNLRNFDQAKVSDKVAKTVADRIADPRQVTWSRQLPMRFLSAYNATKDSVRWAWALEQALTASLDNIPELNGNTLILVDTSGSMHNTFSKDGSLMRWDAAALFGIALAHRCANADVVSFSGGYYTAGEATKVFPLFDGASVLKSLERWKKDGFFIGGGTDTAGAVHKHLTGKHTRLVILTDEQAHYDNPIAHVSTQIPIYTWNLAGYEYGHAPSGTGNHHTFGGLTDQAFKMIPLLEAGRNGDWPWMN